MVSVFSLLQTSYLRSRALYIVSDPQLGTPSQVTFEILVSGLEEEEDLTLP